MKFKMSAVLFLAAALFIISPVQSIQIFAQTPDEKEMMKKKEMEKKEMEKKEKMMKKENAKKSKSSQNREVVELKSNKGTATGDDPNITTGDMPNTMNLKGTPPANKGGNAKSGAGCKVIFDNFTDWRIKLYVNGAYRGTLGGFDDAYLYVRPSPNTVVYARADFDDGSYLYWGPTTYDCRSNEYIHFKMNP